MKEIFPEKYSVVLMGAPGVGKLDFSIDLAHYYLTKKEKVIFITTERSPTDIEKRAETIGKNLTDLASNLYYVDCYSWRLRNAPSPITQKQNIIRISSPESLNEIIVKVEKIMSVVGGSGKVVMHSLSPLFLHSQDQEVIKFLQLLSTRIKEDDGFLLACLQEGVHSPSTINTLRYILDGVLEMRFIEGERIERQMRIHHLKDLPTDSVWRTFTVDKKGFNIDEG